MMIHPRRAVFSLLACMSLLAACGTTESTVNPSTSVAATTEVPTASVAAAPTATPDQSHPVGMIALGHSGLTGEGTGDLYQPNPDKSWATGTAPDVNSVYLRLAAVLPETQGHVANLSQGGATADFLLPQATIALQTVPVPALAIISVIDNDIGCDGTDTPHIPEFGKSVQDGLDAIVAASPNVKILIVGQLGRPRADFVESLVARDPSIKSDLMGSGICDFYDQSGKISATNFANLIAIIQGYEDEEARVCKLYPQCRTDGGVRAAWVDKFEYFSADLNHLNVSGQAAEAELIWPVVKDLMGQ